MSVLSAVVSRWRLLLVACALVAVIALPVLQRLYHADMIALARTDRAFYVAMEIYQDVAPSPDVFIDEMPRWTREEVYGVTYTFIPTQSKTEVIGRIDPEVARKNHLMFVLIGHNEDSRHLIAPFTAVPRLRIRSVRNVYYPVKGDWIFWWSPD